MNWYKKAKLIDADPSVDNSIYTLCSYCNRAKAYGLSNNLVWKKQEELDQEERQQQEAGLNSLNMSHGICPTCHDILKAFDYNIDKNKVKLMSLGL